MLQARAESVPHTTRRLRQTTCHTTHTRSLILKSADMGQVASNNAVSPELMCKTCIDGSPECAAQVCVSSVRARLQKRDGLAYTIAYGPCAPRLLTLWARASPGAQGQ